MIVCSVCKHPHIQSIDDAVLTKDGKTWVSKLCYDESKDNTEPVKVAETTESDDKETK